MDKPDLVEMIKESHEDLKVQVSELFERFKVIQSRVETLYALPAFANDAGVDPAKVQEIKTSPDTNEAAGSPQKENKTINHTDDEKPKLND